MGLKVTRRKGSTVLYITGTLRGIRVRESTGTRDLGLAEEQRISIEAEILRTGTIRRDRHTFEDAVIGYVQDGGEARFLEPLLRHFRGHQIDRISGAMIRDAARQIYPSARPSTLNRQGIVPAQSVINWAHQEHWCGPIRVKRFPEEKAERRTVDRAWIDAFIAAADPALGALQLFLYQNGPRIGEALALQVRDVDLGQLTARLAMTKNGTPHVCHLTAELATHLAPLLADRPGTARVFGRVSRSSTRKAIMTTCARAGIEYVPTHQSGRHSAATALKDAGMTSRAVADAIGWKTPDMVDRTYEHPSEPGRRAAEIMGRKR